MNLAEDSIPTGLSWKTSGTLRQVFSPHCSMLSLESGWRSGSEIDSWTATPPARISRLTGSCASARNLRGSKSSSGSSLWYARSTRPSPSATYSQMRHWGEPSARAACCATSVSTSSSTTVEVMAALASTREVSRRLRSSRRRSGCALLIAAAANSARPLTKASSSSMKWRSRSFSKTSRMPLDAPRTRSGTLRHILSPQASRAARLAGARSVSESRSSSDSPLSRRRLSRGYSSSGRSSPRRSQPVGADSYSARGMIASRDESYSRITHSGEPSAWAANCATMRNASSSVDAVATARLASSSARSQASLPRGGLTAGRRRPARPALATPPADALSCRSTSARRKRRCPPGLRYDGTSPASAQRRTVCSLTPSAEAAAASRIQPLPLPAGVSPSRFMFPLSAFCAQNSTIAQRMYFGKTDGAPAGEVDASSARDRQGVGRAGPRALYESAPTGWDRLGELLPLDEYPLERRLLESGESLEERLSDTDLAPASRAALEAWGCL